MQLDHSWTDDGHVHRLVVTPDADGWEVREEADSAVVWKAHRQDWHRVERDGRLFEARLRAHQHTHGAADLPDHGSEEARRHVPARSRR